MQRLTRGAVLVLTAILAGGCPFEAEVPLGEPRPGSLDARLLGLWTWVDPDGGSVSQVRVQRFNEAEFLVDYDEFGPRAKNAQQVTYRAFAVPIGDQLFLHINPIQDEGETPSFLFARYSFSDCGDLVLRFVGDHALPKSLAADRKALLEALTAHPMDASLDDTEGPMRFVRAGS